MRGTPLASAELYSTRRRSLDRGGLDGHGARVAGMTATTLLDGRVLVVAGTEFAGLPSAELFDPATGAIWTPTGSHARGPVRPHGHAPRRRPRPRHGRLDRRTRRRSASAEIFDPATGTWTMVAPMSSGAGRTHRHPARRRRRARHWWPPGDHRRLTRARLCLEASASTRATGTVVGRRAPWPSAAIGTRRRCCPTAGSSSRAAARPTDRTATAELYDPVDRHVDPGSRHDSTPGRGRPRRGCRTARCWSWAADQTLGPAATSAERFASRLS